MTTRRNPEERLRQQLDELEALIANWEQTNDPHSTWMLYLLREAAELGRLKLKKLERENP